MFAGIIQKHQEVYRDEPALTDAGAIANFHAADKMLCLNLNKK